MEDYRPASLLARAELAGTCCSSQVPAQELPPAQANARLLLARNPLPRLRPDRTHHSSASDPVPRRALTMGGVVQGLARLGFLPWARAISRMHSSFPLWCMFEW